MGLTSLAAMRARVWMASLDLMPFHTVRPQQRVALRRVSSSGRRVVRLQAKGAGSGDEAAASAAPPVGSIGNPQRPTLIQDLVKLLYESEDPLWELVRFEAETSAAQDEKVRFCIVSPDYTIEIGGWVA